MEKGSFSEKRNGKKTGKKNGKEAEPKKERQKFFSASFYYIGFQHFWSSDIFCGTENFHGDVLVRDPKSERKPGADERDD